MLLVELKPLVARLNGYARQALENGVGLCVGRSHYEITVEHLLVKLLDDIQADIPLLLRQHDIDSARIRHAIELSIEDMRTGNAGPHLKPPLLRAGGNRRAVHRGSRHGLVDDGSRTP